MGEVRSFARARSSSTNWTDLFANAAIVSGITFFTVLASIRAIVTNIQPASQIITAILPTAVQFLTSLAIQRGIFRQNLLEDAHGKHEMNYKTSV
ncbi:MAG: hypothetical protein ABSD49_14475 [Candidatus Bathyarchaeia archaeon]